MCYFHVKQACQVKLRGKPMKEQKDVLQGSGVNSTAHLHTTLRTNGILDQHSTNGKSSVVHLVLRTPIIR